MRLKSAKYNSLKRTIFQKHHHTLTSKTSNSLNETRRERHAQLLPGQGRDSFRKLIESRQVLTCSHPVATINYDIVEGFYKIRYLGSKKNETLSHFIGRISGN
jgi:hypothetical protein